MRTFLTVLILLTGLSVYQPLLAQAKDDVITDRSATGGAQTLEDILARQKGEKVDYEFRENALGNTGAPGPMSGALGSLGLTSDAEIFRQLRYNKAQLKVSNNSAASEVLVQDAGMTWLQIRSGPLTSYGGGAMLGIIVLLAVFYVLRGRIPVEGGTDGRTIERFSALERFAHWLLASSFILLGLTGLVTLFGRLYLIPVIGHESFSNLAILSKWIHNNVAWAFMISLVLVLVFWLKHNIPTKLDIKWLIKGGGMFSSHSHPSARKFNAGQKIIFWVVILLGTSVSLSGLSLLFPFELPMFAATFTKINALGLPGLLGTEPLPEILLPHEEMQLSQIWHSVVAFIMMVVIIAHIYIGSVGMEGAYDAMGSGQVDVNWAKQHHDLWADEVEAKNESKPSSKHSMPAE